MKQGDLDRSGKATLIKRGRSIITMFVEGVGVCKHHGAYGVVTGYLLDKGYDLGAIEAWTHRVGFRAVMRLNNWIIRSRVLNDNTMGELRITRDGWGLRAYRQRGDRSHSTCFVMAPKSWLKRFAHVKDRAVHNEGGELLYYLT